MTESQLVHFIAGQMHRKMPLHVELDDVRQNGFVGLLDAKRKFKSGRGLKFTTYANHRIRGAILDAQRAEDFVSRKERKQSRDSGVSVVTEIFTLDSFVDVVPDRALNPEQQLAAKQSIRELWCAVDSLNLKHAQVLRMYYCEELSMKEIGRRLGLVESRISQIHSAAVRKLAAKLGTE